MAKNRISELDVAQISPMGVTANSPETRTIDPRYLKVTDGQVVSKKTVTGDFSYVDASWTNEVYEKPGVPHMDDVSIVKNSTYVDAKNNVRTKIIFKVKNSSGEDIVGVDARLEVKTGVDQ
jgi:hypothetical protein